MPGAEAFTVLAVLEAQDRASTAFEKVDRSLAKFMSDAQRAAESARVSGDSIDESLLKTASGADALDLAAAKVAGSEAKLAAATAEQAEAERSLLAARDAAAGENELAAASDRLAVAQRNAAKAAAELKDAQEVQAATQQATSGETTAAAAAAGGLSKGFGIAALGLAAAGGMAVKAAGDFQSSTQHLVTDAGESQSNLKMIQQGILDVSTATGTSASALSDAMYHIESAGFHGSAGLTLLKTAAEGAKVGGADFETVAKTLTGTMNAYNMTGDQATGMMNALIAAVGSGDMRMQDLASSLGNVAPLAAAAGISFDQVGGAIATMTGQNMSAQQATQDLAGTIRALSNPNKQAIDEMQQMGIDSNDLAQNLGKRGLTGTLEAVTTAIAQHTQGGQVFIDTLKSSKNAAADAALMMKQLPASVQGAAKGFLDGSVSTQQFNKDIKSLSPEQQHLAQQFERTAKNADSFNQLLTSGSPAAQTMNAALAKVLGGATGLNTALMLTGGRMETFKNNTATVAEALNKGGSQVEDWDKIQGTFNQKLDQTKASIEAAGIALGTVLLPVASKVADAIVKVVVPMAEWIDKNRTMVGLIATVVGVLATGIGVIKGIEMATRAWAAAQVLLDAAMDANPIGLIIVAIAALVAGVIYAWTHFKGFRDVVIAVFEGVKGSAMAAWHFLEAVWHGIATGVTWLWHQMQGAWEGIVSGVTGLWHDIEGIWDSVWAVTQSVWNAISGFFEKWWPLLYAIFATPLFLLQAAWVRFHTEIENTARRVWNAVAGFFVSIWDHLKSAATEAWSLIKTYIIQPIEQVWSYFTAGWSAMVGWLSGVWSSVSRVAASAWNLVYQYIIWPMRQTWNDLVGIANGIVNTIGNAFDSALRWVNGIVNQFDDIGWNIVMGIIHGVEHAGGSLFSSLRNLANGALNAAKSALGISSPSRVMADEVGQWIPHGIAQGVAKHASAATGAVASLAAALPRAAGGAGGLSIGLGTPGLNLTAGLGLSAVGSGPAGAGPAVYVDLRGSQVLGNQAMDQLADKIGRRITVRQLPAAGRRITA